jgi:hypothetical protein
MYLFIGSSKGKHSVQRWAFLVFVFASALSPDPIYAETDEVTTLGEIRITATRTKKNALDAPSTVHSLSFEELQDERMVRTVPEILRMRITEFTGPVRMNLEETWSLAWTANFDDVAAGPIFIFNEKYPGNEYAKRAKQRLSALDKTDKRK